MEITLYFAAYFLSASVCLAGSLPLGVRAYKNFIISLYCNTFNAQSSPKFLICFGLLWALLYRRHGVIIYMILTSQNFFKNKFSLWTGCTKPCGIAMRRQYHLTWFGVLARTAPLFMFLFEAELRDSYECFNIYENL